MKHGNRAVKVVLRIAAVLLTLLVFLAVFFAAAEGITERFARILPGGAEDVLPILKKEEWTEEDYRTLYLATGLTKLGIDPLKGKDEEILAFYDAFRYEGEVAHVSFALTKHEFLAGFFAPVAPLEDGDVLVTSACHTLGWRHGHSAIVTDAAHGRMIESTAPGCPSETGDVGWFANCPNFLLLRLKGASKEERAEIARLAEERLLGIPYSLFLGIFHSKDQGETPKLTNCSHLVWQAFEYFGYDIDSDGGPICTSRDIANSDLFEIVQVYGFDPEKLW